METVNLTKEDLFTAWEYAVNTYGEFISKDEVNDYIEESFNGGRRVHFGSSWHSGHSHFRMTVELHGKTELRVTIDFKIFQEEEFEETKVISR